MKKIYLAGITVFFLIAQATAQTKTFELTGDVAKLKNVRKAVLVYQAGGKQIIDSVAITDGKFKFTGAVDGPTLSELWAIDRSFRNVQYIENNHMTITQKDPGDDIVLTGSATDNDYSEIRKNLREYQSLLRKAGEEREQLKADSSAAMKRYEELRQEAVKKYLLRAEEFVKEHPGSVVSLHELNKTAADMDPVVLQSLYGSLAEALRLSPSGEQLGKTVEVKMKTRVGANAMNFIQKDDKGAEVSLASFKGKYVLIDFWASWCGPCRKENPNVVKVYNRYKNKGFEIIGISLDEKEDKWKDAIAKDHLNWTQLSDLGGWNNAVAVQYGVMSVPASYLLNPQGVIIAKDLRGEDLEKTLAKLLPE